MLNSWNSRLSLMAVAAAAAVGILFFPRPGRSVEASLAPDFRLRDTRGHLVSLSTYRGKPVLINFFTTWCGPCRHDLPEIDRARQHHPGLVTLLIDRQEGASQVRSFLREVHIRMPALLDEDGGVASRYRIVGQPVTVWVAPSGRLRFVSQGPIDAWTIDARYRQLLQS